MQNIDEGYIKFGCHHKKVEKLPVTVPEELKKNKRPYASIGFDWSLR